MDTGDRAQNLLAGNTVLTEAFPSEVLVPEPHTYLLLTKDTLVFDSERDILIFSVKVAFIHFSPKGLKH